MRHRLFKEICVSLIVCAVSFCWWGILYPQLTLLPDTYRVVCPGEQTGAETGSQLPEKETDSGQIAETAQKEWKFDNDIYEEILNADRSQIRFRSRLLEELAGYLE